MAEANPDYNPDEEFSPDEVWENPVWVELTPSENTLNYRYSPYRYVQTEIGPGKLKYSHDISEYEATILDQRYQHLYGRKWVRQNIRWIPGGLTLDDTAFTLVLVLRTEQGEEWLPPRKELEKYYRIHLEKTGLRNTLVTPRGMQVYIQERYGVTVYRETVVNRFRTQ